MKSYDVFPWCEVCGVREAERRFGLGDLGVCRECFEVLDAKAEAEKNFKAGVRDGDKPTAPVPISPVTTERGSDANAVQGATDQKQSAA